VVDPAWTATSLSEVMANTGNFVKLESSYRHEPGAFPSVTKLYNIFVTYYSQTESKFRLSI